MAGKALPKSDIRWLVGHFHVSLSNLQLCREMYKRTKGWTLAQRKRGYKYAIQCHQENQGLYDYVTKGRTR